MHCIGLVNNNNKIIIIIIIIMIIIIIIIMIIIIIIIIIKIYYYYCYYYTWIGIKIRYQNWSYCEQSLCIIIFIYIHTFISYGYHFGPTRAK